MMEEEFWGWGGERRTVVVRMGEEEGGKYGGVRAMVKATVRSAQARSSFISTRITLINGAGRSGILLSKMYRNASLLN